MNAEPKLFSIDEANRMLPLVSVIVRDVRTTFREYTAGKKELGQLRRSAVTGSDDAAARRTLDEKEAEVRTLSDELKALVRELTALDALLRDPIRGVVDFPFERDGSTAYLCWQFGEKSITTWHTAEAGFAGRQPLEPVAPPA